jgi:hypothetical protein
VLAPADAMGKGPDPAAYDAALASFGAIDPVDLLSSVGPTGK